MTLNDPDGPRWPQMAPGDPPSTLPWLADFFSIPQRNPSCQRLAIDSIVLYAPYAHAFIAVAPSAQRPGSGERLSTVTYARRMW